MRLFRVDIRLHRVRLLFCDPAELNQAHARIQQCDYGRRQGALEDAEQAERGW